MTSHTPMHIGHLALRSPDPERLASFLTKILGLRRTAEHGGAIYLSCNEKHHEIELLPGPVAGMDHIGLEVEQADLERLRDSVAAAGAPILGEYSEQLGLGRGFRTVGPAGIVFEIYCGMERERLSIQHYMPPLARRFGHVTLATDQRKEAADFLCEVLGFRVTDTLGDRLVWLRCDAEHHGIAFVDADKNALHHYAFQLENWSTLERYADHLAFVGERLVWGIGRHGPGRNLFTYLPDPDNTIVEAYADLLLVQDEAGYVPIDWDAIGESSLNLWGPMPPPGWRDYGVPILAPESIPTPTS
jgi:catechol-2,3-dioxygenase